MPDTSKKQIPSSLIPEQNPTGTSLESEDLSLAQALRTIRKRKYIILGLLVLGGLLAFVLVTALRPYYSSLAAIEVDRQTGDMGANALAGLAASLGGSDDVKTEITTEVSILTSDALGIEVIDRMHYEDHATGAWRFSRHFERTPSERGLPLLEAPVTRESLLYIFESHLTITPLPDTRLVQIAFEDPNPKYAAEVTNALIDQYVKDRLSRRNSSTLQASEWMGGEIDNLKKQVQTSEEALIDYQRKTGLIVLPAAPSSGGGGGGLGGAPSGGGSPTTATSPVIERLTQLNVNLVQAETNRITLEALYRLAKEGNVDALTSVGGGGGPSSSGGGASGGASSGSTGIPSGLLAGLMAIRQQQTTLRMQIAAGLQTYGAKNPHLIDLDQQMQVLDTQLREEMKRVVNSLEMNYNVALQAEEGLKRAYADEEHKAFAMNDSEIHLAVLQQEADSVRALYEDLYTKLQESKLSEGTQSSDIELISQALTPAAPARPKKILDLALGLGAGLFLGLAAAFVVDSMDDTVITSVELETLTGRPVVGSIPMFAQLAAGQAGKSENRDDKISTAEPGSANWGAFEAYRALRTTILLSSAGAPPRSLLLTSPLPGEGKTTTTYNLAACFAMLGSKVLAIDADLRRPALNKRASISNITGLTNVLTSNLSVADVIQQDPQQPNLFIMPSGPIPPNPSELLGSQTFADMIAKLTVDYDFVLVDTPPAMLVADALVMSQRVDQVLVVTRSGMATRASVVRVIEKLHRINAPLLGFVLNSVDTKSADYYYAHGYYGTDYYGTEKGGKNGK